MAKNRKVINLALQGGGAHGAFTWGVLDRLLEEDEEIGFKGLSGTSAGAMNAVVLADGYVRSGADGAREALEAFWKAMSVKGRMTPMPRTPFDSLLGGHNLDLSPGYIFFDMISRFASPYDFNPLDINPLRDTMGEMINFDRVNRCDCFDLFVCATNVHSGKIRVFHNEEITLDAVMASACLPMLYKAVEIDGVPYWDGGYMGNPPIYPLIYHTDVEDVLLIQINPIERAETPKTARDIMNRMNEITFNSTMLRELRAIDFVKRLREEGKVPEGRYKTLRMHRIDGGDDLLNFSASSKFNTNWTFLQELKEIGRARASSWLEENKAHIGEKSTFDLRSEFE